VALFYAIVYPVRMLIVPIANVSHAVEYVYVLFKGKRRAALNLHSRDRVRTQIRGSEAIRISIDNAILVSILPCGFFSDGVLHRLSIPQVHVFSQVLEAFNLALYGYVSGSLVSLKP